MRFIVIALHAEANPIIEALNLKQTQKKPFSLYENKSIKLIISGIGNINASSATTYLLTKYHSSAKDIIINIGICSTYHEDERIGTLYEIDKIIHASTNKVYHLNKKNYLTQTALLTSFATPQSKKHPKYHLADMESIGFYLASKKFMKYENIYLFKIVSDHLNDEILKHQEVETMIEKHLPLFHKLLNTKDEV